MTKDEAIRILEQICPKRPQKLWSVKRKEAVKMAIEALTHFNSDSNSIKNELNELSCSEKPNRSDVIKRQDAINALIEWVTKLFDDRSVVDVINEVPSAQPVIIRCKDCWHYPSEYADCPMIGWARNENDFCSKAERRTDVKADKGASH